MTTDEGVVLNRTRYGDSGLIVNVFTKSRGLQGFFVNGARSRNSKQKANQFQPLSPIQFTVNYKQVKGLPRFKEVQYSFPLNEVFVEPLKQTLALFMAEVLDRCLTNQLSDNQLYLWMVRTITKLDQTDNCALFPHLFLLELSDILGFSPDDTEGHCFDLMEGCFLSKYEVGSHTLTEQESNVLYLFITNKSSNNFSSIERNQLLNNLLKYFEFHVDGIQYLKSLEVIRAVYYS